MDEQAFRRKSESLLDSIDWALGALRYAKDECGKQAVQYMNEAAKCLNSAEWSQEWENALIRVSDSMPVRTIGQRPFVHAHREAENRISQILLNACIYFPGDSQGITYPSGFGMPIMKVRQMAKYAHEQVSIERLLELDSSRQTECLAGFTKECSESEECSFGRHELKNRLMKEREKAVADMKILLGGSPNGQKSGESAAPPKGAKKMGLTTNADVNRSESGDTVELELTNLLAWAETELKGKQRLVIELLVKGNCKQELATIAETPGIDWELPLENAWYSIQKILNEKLGKRPSKWQISTHNKSAQLSRIGQK